MSVPFTYEKAQQLTTEELSSIHWDMFKEIHGFRPRHVASDDREAFLTFLEYELRPEVQEERRAQWEAEAAYYDELEREHEEALQLELAEMKAAEELVLAYDDTYFDLEEKYL